MTYKSLSEDQLDATSSGRDEEARPAEAEADPPSEDNTYEGMAYVAMSAFSFSVMSLFVKMLANRGLPSFEIAFFNAFGRSVICLAMVARDGFSLGEKGREYLVFLRAVFGYGGLATCFYGISVLPLGDATTIIFTAPVLYSPTTPPLIVSLDVHVPKTIRRGFT